MENDYRIAAVEKSLDILEYLAEQREERGLPELSKALHIPKATMFRYLVTLEQRGYVRKNPQEEKYGLGLKLLELSNHIASSLTLHEVAIPYMRELLAQFQETVNLAVLDDCEIVYIEILESPRTFRMSSHVGGRELPHATALGKALLAYLPESEVRRIAAASGLPKRTPATISSLPQLLEELAAVRRVGYATDYGENEEGAHCVGVPLFDYRGNVIAALSISGPSFRSSPMIIQEMGAALVEVSAQISKRIGFPTQR